MIDRGGAPIGNALRRKLHSRTGASLLIALLFFLVALTVGAVALTAAATNAGRVARNRREQQDYLAVASAALLVKEDLRGTTFTMGYQKTTVTSTDEEGNSRSDVYYDKTSPVLSGEGELLRDGPKNDLARLYYSTAAALHTAAPAEMKYELEITAEKLPDVFGSMEVDRTETGRYTITVVLYTRTEDGGHANSTTLLFTPAVSNTQSTAVSGDGSRETTTYTTAVAWDAPVITKGAVS